MLAAMARGDESKTTSKANYACKSFEVTAPMQKPAYKAPQPPARKPEQNKEYGAWGPIYKDKKSFTEMHLC